MSYQAFLAGEPDDERHIWGKVSTLDGVREADRQERGGCEPVDHRFPGHRVDHVPVWKLVFQKSVFHLLLNTGFLLAGHSAINFHVVLLLEWS